MSTRISSRPTSPETRHGLGPLSSNEIVIGLALGSPTESPLAPFPREYLDQYVSPFPSQENGQDVDYLDDASRTSYDSPKAQSTRSHRSGSRIKRSGSRWKNLGSLFSKKAPPVPATEGPPFYMLDRRPQRERAGSAHTIILPDVPAVPSKPTMPAVPEPQFEATCSAAAPPVQEGGARAMLRRVSTRRKGVRKRARAQTTGSLESSRRTPAKARFEDSEISDERAGAPTWLRLDDGAPEQEPAGGPSIPDASSLLQIEIPSVELERYSVMFGDVLPPKSTQAPPLRPYQRQSLLQELKPVLSERENMTGDQVFSPLSSNPPLSSSLPRPPHARKDSTSSTGSKSSTKSGHYGLFPSPKPAQKRKSAGKAPVKPSPLSRSIMTPNVTVASPRPIVKTSKSQDQNQNQLTIVIDEPEALSPLRTHASPDLGGHHRRTSSFNPSDFSDHSTSASHFDYLDDFEGNEYARPISANGQPRETPSTIAFPTRKSSMRAPVAAPITASAPRLTFPARSVSVHRLANATGEQGEVSIARKVSITRQQRNLVPIVPQVPRQPMQARLISSCSTPALRQSHPLTLEAVVDSC